MKKALKLTLLHLHSDVHLYSREHSGVHSVLHHHQLNHQCTCPGSGAAHCCTAAANKKATIVKDCNNC